MMLLASRRCCAWAPTPCWGRSLHLLLLGQEEKEERQKERRVAVVHPLLLGLQLRGSTRWVEGGGGHKNKHQ
jgi:hypothetical protein